MIATLRRCNLPDSVLRVEQQRSLLFRKYSAFCVGIHIARLKLFDIHRQQADAMRIHSTQIRGDQGGTGQLSYVFRNANCSQYLTQKTIQVI